MPTELRIPPILLNDFGRFWFDVGEPAQAAFKLVGESGWYILGKAVERFERDLAVYSSVAHVVGCANGLDALELGLRALEIRPGDKVLTTPMSAFATTLAILRAGGIPVFADVDDHGLVDLDMAREAFEKDPELRAFVPVHLYGRSLNLQVLQRLKDDFNLKIVEDMAQAVGATHNDQPVGSVGQIAATSFYPTKNLGCLGDGGAVLTNDPVLAKRCRTLRDYGQASKYEHVALGMNSRLDELQAALLADVFLPRLSTWTARRKAIAKTYGRSILNPKVRLPAASEESVWHLYALQTAQRDALMQYLKSNNVQTAVHYPKLIPDQPCLEGYLADVPHARQQAEQTLSLPIHPYLSDEEVDRVVHLVNAWME